jgi:hypothetical protein
MMDVESNWRSSIETKVSEGQILWRPKHMINDHVKGGDTSFLSHWIESVNFRFYIDFQLNLVQKWFMHEKLGNTVTKYTRVLRNLIISKLSDDKY